MRESLTTVGPLIDGGYRIAVYCEEQNCNHRGEIDLVALEERYGPGCPTMYKDLKPWLTCTRCGARNASVRLQPATGTAQEVKARQWRRRQDRPLQKEQKHVR